MTRDNLEILNCIQQTVKDGEYTALVFNTLIDNYPITAQTHLVNPVVSFEQIKTLRRYYERPFANKKTELVYSFDRFPFAFWENDKHQKYIACSQFFAAYNGYYNRLVIVGEWLGDIER